MNSSIHSEALHIKKLIREAEALSDEVMIACAKLKQAMIAARQNPDVPVDTGQRAIMRLSQAEQQAMGMSTNLLRVHDELSKVARVYSGGEGGIPTDIPAAALSEFAVSPDASADLENALI